MDHFDRRPVPQVSIKSDEKGSLDADTKRSSKSNVANNVERCIQTTSDSILSEAIVREELRAYGKHE